MSRCNSFAAGGLISNCCSGLGLTPELSRQLGLSENTTSAPTSLATTPETPAPFWSPMPKRRLRESPDFTEGEDGLCANPWSHFARFICT